MKKKSYKYDYVLHQCVSDDSVLKPQMLIPNQDNNFVYSSDGHILCCIHSEYLAGNYPSNEKYPNCYKLLSAQSYTEKELILDIEKMAKVLAQSKFEYEREMCRICSGSGEITCDSCGHDHECEECDGTGYAGQIADFSYKKSKNKWIIEIAGLYFKPHYIDRILNCACVLGCNKITLKINQNVNSLHLFVLDNIQIGLMPCMDDPDYEIDEF